MEFPLGYSKSRTLFMQRGCDYCKLLPVGCICSQSRSALKTKSASAGKKNSGKFYNLLENTLMPKSKQVYRPLIIFRNHNSEENTAGLLPPDRAPPQLPTLWVFTQGELWRENTEEHCLPSTAWNICLLGLGVEFSSRTGLTEERTSSHLLRDSQ